MIYNTISIIYPGSALFTNSFFTKTPQISYKIRKKFIFSIFFSGRKLDLEKVILSDFVLRKQNARAPCAAPPVTLRSKWSVATGGWIVGKVGGKSRRS
ncbi:MAG: hypothetical protein IJY46_09775 [Lentisphaeria bacterium]|nr:hypothetical protein [Lentisphaeria bacterium]